MKLRLASKIGNMYKIREDHVKICSYRREYMPPK